jgi:hypothetical protein
MIDLLKLTRKNVVNLWSILGNKWLFVKNNIFARRQIEGFWSLLDILSNGRLNELTNIYDRVNQLSIYGVLDFCAIPTKSIQKIKDIKYPYETTLYYNKLDPTKKIKYLFPFPVLTNTLLPANYAYKLTDLTVLTVNGKNKWLQFMENPVIKNSQIPLYGYVFHDSKSQPFIIKKIVKDILYYDVLIKNTEPVLDTITITNKIELHLNKDFLCEPSDDHMHLKFKEFKYIENFYEPANSLFSYEKTLYAVNANYLDEYNVDYFGEPIGVDINKLSSKFTAQEKEKKIIELWRIQQRPFNFQQSFRLGSVLADESYIKNINKEQLIFELDEGGEYVKTATIKDEYLCRVLRFTDLSTNKQTEFNNQYTEKSVFNIIELQTGSALNFIKDDIYFINGKSFKIKRIFNDKYFEVDGEVGSGDYITRLYILNSKTAKEYPLNSYNVINTGDTDILPFRKIAWGQKDFKQFKWGEIYGKKVYQPCVFKKPILGDKYRFGDSLTQTLIADYFENSVYPDLIQKQLANENKPFTQANVESFYKSPALVLSPFINFGINDPKKYLEYLITEDDEYIIQTEDGGKIILSANGEWAGANTAVIEEKQVTSYNLNYLNVKLPNNGDYIFYNFTLNPNSTTNICVLSFYARVHKGLVKIGVSNSVSFNDSIYFKNIGIKGDSWIHKKIFFNKADILANRILIEAGTDDTEFDIFGIEFYQSVGTFVENIYDNKEIFNTFLKSNDYKLINLL